MGYSWNGSSKHNFINLYRFVHIGIAHYVFNMIMQLLVGVFLEMEQA